MLDMLIQNATCAKSCRVMLTHASLSLTRKLPPPVAAQACGISLNLGAAKALQAATHR